MKEKHLATLEQIGLSTAEAEIYLALVRAGTPMSASAIVSATRVPRGSIYPTLDVLADKGLVEAEPGYGGRFSAVPAQRALPFLIKREKEELIERENLAELLAEELKSEGEPVDSGLESEIEILKDPRVLSERFDRLQREAQQHIEVFTKAPIFSRPGNAEEDNVLRRGVRARSIYEAAVLDDPGIKPYLMKWVSAGEKARVYDGELPHKLAIFDSKAAVMPLIVPGKRVKAVLIRHSQLVKTLSVAFEFFWERSTPLVEYQKPISKSKKSAKATPKVDRQKTQASRDGDRPLRGGKKISP